jgi:tetratricopeptide (TPR) repeat protein
MTPCARILLVVGAAILSTTPALAQGTWVGHRDPCKLNTGHYLLKSGILYLKMAVETRFPDERDRRLREAREVLHRAILEKDQGENAAVWYYLGRAYAEAQDLVGADTAFRQAATLAPDCASDIAIYAQPLSAIALNDALRTWGASHPDSAKRFFRLAASLDSADAEVPLYLTIMLASLGEPDSAAAELEIGLRTAQTDTTHRARQKDAELAVPRAYEAQAYQNPVVSRAAGTRARRDSAVEVIAQDSTVRARMLQDVAEIRARGRHLDAQSLAVFQRESTTVERRLADERGAHDSLQSAAAADSLGAAAALAPAIAGYRRYIEHYPEDADAAMQLVRLYSAVGDRPSLDELVAHVANSPYPTEAALIQAALSLYNDGLVAPSGRLLEAALARNPNNGTALSVLVHVYHAQGRAEPLMATARHLLDLDPLDPGSARAMALAFDIAGLTDSAARYLALADTGLGWNVNVLQFQSREQNTTLSGYVRNASRRALPATSLVFDFLDTTGQVLFSTMIPVSALDPNGRQSLAIRLEQGGAAAWRYRRE